MAAKGKMVNVKGAVPTPFLESVEQKAYEVYEMFDCLWTAVLKDAKSADQYAKMLHPLLKLAVRERPSHVDHYIQFLKGKILVLELFKTDIHGKQKKGKSAGKNPGTKKR